MEILDLKLAGIPLWTWGLVFAVCYFAYRIYVATRMGILDWQQRRAEKREYERMKPLRDEQERQIAEVGQKVAELSQKVAEAVKRLERWTKANQ